MTPDAPIKKDYPETIVQIDTRKFCELWNTHNTLRKEGTWEEFVSTCWYEFVAGGGKTGPRNDPQKENAARIADYIRTKNPAGLTEPDITKWPSTDYYSFMSNRCYSKALAIRRRLLAEAKKSEALLTQVPDLPKGYEARNGESSRITNTEMFSIFNKPAS